MNEVTSWIGLVVLVLSMNGYFLLIRHRLNIRMEFVPILTVSGSIILLMAAGAVMKLKWGVLFFVVCGIGALIYEIWYIVKKKVSLKTLFDKRTIAVYVLFFAVAVYYMLYFKGHYLIGYDTFTHWGSAVKIMLYNDRFPARWDTLTWHSSYPPGAQAFEYLICRVTDNWSDGMMMFGQAMIYMACIFAFAGVCKNCIVLIPLAIASCIWIRDLVYSLSVDTMLGFVSAAGFAMLICYRDEIKTRWWMILPVIAILPAIKDAGFYHFAALVIWYSVFFFKNKDFTRKQKAIRFLILAVILLIPFLSWRYYIHVYTPASLSTRHTFDLSYMQWVSGLKGSEKLNQQAQAFWNSLMNIDLMRPTFRILTVSILLGILSTFAGGKGRRKTSIWFIVFAVLSFAVYNACLLGMYLFEMPEDTLGSFSRYQGINNALVFLMSVVLFASNIRNFKQMKLQVIPVALACGIIFWYGWNGLKKEPLKYPDNNETQQKTIASMMKEHPDQKPAVYTAGHNQIWHADISMANYYYYKRQNYTLITSSPREATQHTLEEWKDYADYLIVLLKDDAFTQYCEENGYDANEDLLLAN